MSKSAGALAARQQVYAQLVKRFPASAIGWVRSAVWEPVRKVGLDRFDTAGQSSWAAASQPQNVDREVQKWQDGSAEPIVAVQVGGSPQYVIIDGHHRYIARERMHKGRVLAWVGHVPSANGPWMETHSFQIGGDSA
jgi:hypothetical protein